MELVELHSLSASQVADLLQLMQELNPALQVSGAMLFAVAESDSAHLFAAVAPDGHIVGTATLCLFVSPTGTKGKIEDVVVSSACRGQGLGRRLMEFALDFARNHHAPLELALTSNPSRVAANRLYQELGFQPYQTNVYKLEL